jgi:hypothetical protein
MSIESLPTFTKPARKQWDAIPEKFRKELLANIWCGKCREATMITNFSCAMKGGDLLLVGKYAVCHRDVARLVEKA